MEVNGSDEVFQGPHAAFITDIFSDLSRHEVLEFCATNSIPTEPQLDDIRALLGLFNGAQLDMIAGYLEDIGADLVGALDPRTSPTGATSSRDEPYGAAALESASSGDSARDIIEPVCVDVGLQSYCEEQVEKIQEWNLEREEEFVPDLVKLNSIIKDIIAKKDSLVGERCLHTSIPIVDFIELIDEIYLVLEMIDVESGLSYIFQQELNSDFKFDDPTHWTEPSMIKAKYVADQLLNSVNNLFPKEKLTQIKVASPDQIEFIQHRTHMIRFYVKEFKSLLDTPERRLNFSERLKNYSSVNQIRSECPHDICPICLEDLTEDREVTILNVCPHLFCVPCWNNWKEEQKSCPVCIRPVNFTVTSTYMKQYFIEQQLANQ